MQRFCKKAEGKVLYSQEMYSYACVVGMKEMIIEFLEDFLETDSLSLYDSGEVCKYFTLSKLDLCDFIKYGIVVDKISS